MLKILEKFVQILEKVDNYYILTRDAESVIVGTKIIIKVHQKHLGNIFQPRESNVDKELPVFFLITIAAKPSALEKDFLKKKLPILNINNKKEISTKESIKQLLAEFVVSNFLH